LRRLISEFPDGLPGISLLLLRAVLGVALLIEGGFYVIGPDRRFATYAIGLLAVASAGLLVIGFLTQLAGIVTGLAAVGVLLSLLPGCTPNVFDSRSAVVFAVAILIALIGIGPGRFSVDARLFGRREIIVPPHEFPPER
jgi:uncharacterized membrane protein YphA (DoxX/SURF4 family)